MLKYKVTNTSQKTEKGARNVFLIEAGKLLKPGDSCTLNRLDPGTRLQGDAGVLKIEEGSFVRAPIFPSTTPSPADDDDAKADEKPKAETKAETKAEGESQRPLPPRDDMSAWEVDQSRERKKAEAAAKAQKEADAKAAEEAKAKEAAELEAAKKADDEKAAAKTKEKADAKAAKAKEKADAKAAKADAKAAKSDKGGRD